MRYRNIGEELSFESALIQATQALDLAGRVAAENRDGSELHRLAETWVKMADFMISLAEAQDKKELDKELDAKSDFPTGFQSKKDDDAGD